MKNFLQKPNVIVHLDVSPEESLRRIHARSRDCESSISLEYLRALHAGYEEFLSDISRVIPVIKVDYERFRTVNEMAEAIAQQYHEMSNIRHVRWNDRRPSDSSNQPSSETIASTESVTDMCE